MGVKWTAEQTEAIKARDCNLLVAAAAGSGKTAVLVERIIGRVLDEKNPVDIDRLLVVTFTNAAAAEMRERIGAAIASRIEETSGKEESSQYHWLRRQLALINKSKITTIHSFCQDVIKQYYHRVNIDPSFSIADETQTEIIKSDILDELMDDLYENDIDDKLFRDLVDCYGGGRSDEGLKNIILNAANFINSCPFPEKWLSEQVNKFNMADSKVEDFSQTEWGTLILDNFILTADNLAGRLKYAMDLAEGAEYAGYCSTLQADLEAIKNFREMARGSWDELYMSLNIFTFMRLGRCGKNADKQTQDLIKSIREEVKKEIDDYKKKIVNAPSEEILEDLSRMYPMLSRLAEIIFEFRKRYMEYKKKKCIIDFNDMEHYALQILADIAEDGSIKPSQVAMEYRDRFEEVYTDEYQDSNLTQEVILSLVSRESPKMPDRFMVGDIKQSIYGFRQARPDIFLGKYEKYPQDPGGADRLIRLFKNFRSRKDVIGSVNYIFSRIMTKSAGEIDYGRDEYLYYGADYPESPSDTACELIIGDLGQEASGDSEAAEIYQEEYGELPGAVQFEAILTARKIHELVKGDGKPFQVYDRKTGAYRDIKFSDIVILMRSTSKNGEIFAQELTSREIPVFWDTGSGFFITKEVQLILSLLQIIDNPYQDIPLLTVMRSPIGGFSDEELVDLRLVDRKNIFYSNLVKYSSQEDAEASLKSKVQEFLNKLDKWRSDSFEKTTADLIWQLYSDTGYYDMVGLLPNGEKKKANLSMLFERALQYEKNGSVGIFNFLSYVDKLRSSGDLGSATVLGENDNVVRIMSIHKSKGLEFPVVFLCDCSKVFNKQDQNQKIIFHQELGLGPDFIDPDVRIIYSTKAKKAVQLKQDSESVAEEMRILYVAMTRAKEKLIISGIMKKVPEKLARLGSQVVDGKLSAFNALNARSYFDWILPVLLKHPDMGKMRCLAGVYEGEGLIMPGDAEECRWDFSYSTLSDILKDEISDFNDLQDGEQSESDDADGNTDSNLDNTDNNIEATDDRGPFDCLSEEYSAANWVDNEVARRLEWKYPYGDLSRVPVKLTVSELKRLKETEEDGERLYAYIPALVKKPEFLIGKVPPTAAQKGSATHFVMQNVDLDKIKAVINNNGEKNRLINVIKDEIAALKDKAMMTEEEASWVNAGVIAEFFMGSMGRRLLNSPEVKREIPFTMEMKASEVYNNISPDLSDERIAVQGIVDCYFIEDDGYIMIDYKTDRVSKDDIVDAAMKYAVQIKTYVNAIERGTGISVKEAYVYFLSVNESVRIA